MGRYGSVSECLCAGTPMVFLRRDYFNEEPFLRRLLQLHGGGADPPTPKPCVTQTFEPAPHAQSRIFIAQLCTAAGVRLTLGNPNPIFKPLGP